MVSGWITQFRPSIEVGTKTYELVSHMQKTGRIKRILYKTNIKFEIRGLKKVQTLKDSCDDKSSWQSRVSKENTSLSTQNEA